SSITLFNGYQTSIIIGFDRIYSTKNVDTICGLLQIGSTCIYALLVPSLIGIVATYSVWSIVTLIANRILVSRIVDRRRFSTSASVLRYIWPQVWRSGIGILMSTGIIQRSALIVPQFTTSATAASNL